jgi:hypothetical protein
MFFRKKLPTVDVELYELSKLLFLDNETPVPNVDFFNSFDADYSLDSLKYIEDYLNSLRDSKELEGNYNLIVLRVGAYLGEVIRNNSNKDYHWYDFETGTKLQPIISDYGKSIATSAVLHSSKSGDTTFPINKVCKYIENGSDDSLVFFAQVTIEK